MNICFDLAEAMFDELLIRPRFIHSAFIAEIERDYCFDSDAHGITVCLELWDFCDERWRLIKLISGPDDALRN